MNKQLTSFQNSFGILSRLCQGKSWKTFSPFKCPLGKHKSNSRAICCKRDMGWADLHETKN